MAAQSSLDPQLLAFMAQAAGDAPARETDGERMTRVMDEDRPIESVMPPWEYVQAAMGLPLLAGLAPKAVGLAKMLLKDAPYKAAAYEAAKTAPTRAIEEILTGKFGSGPPEDAAKLAAGMAKDMPWWKRELEGVKAGLSAKAPSAATLADEAHTAGIVQNVQAIGKRVMDRRLAALSEGDTVAPVIDRSAATNAGRAVPMQASPAQPFQAAEGQVTGEAPTGVVLGGQPRMSVADQIFQAEMAQHDAKLGWLNGLADHLTQAMPK